MRLLNAGQIYTTLARLNAKKWVSNETVAQKNSPARKVYHLTETGRTALAEWLAAPLTDNYEQVRSEFFLKLLVHGLVIGSQAGGSSSQPMIERQRQQFHQSMDELRHSRLQLTLVLPPGTADPRPSAEQEAAELRLLLLEGAMLHLEADLQWLNLIEARLNRLSGIRGEGKEGREGG